MAMVFSGDCPMSDRFTYCPELLAREPRDRAAKLFVEAMFDAGLMRPAASAKQLADAIQGDQIQPAPQSPARDVAAYSPGWHAASAGSALGMLLPLAAVVVGRKNIMRFAQRSAPSPLWSSSVLQTGVDGAAFHTLFVPSTHGESLLREKTTGAVASALTFSSIAQSGKVLNRFASGTARLDLAMHAASGAIGGTTSVFATSLLCEGRLPRTDDVAQSIYSFAALGMAMRGCQMKLGNHVRSTSEPAVETKLPSPASGNEWLSVRAEECAWQIEAPIAEARPTAPGSESSTCTSIVPYVETLRNRPVDTLRWHEGKEREQPSHERSKTELWDGGTLHWNGMLPETIQFGDGLTATFSYHSGPFGFKTMNRIQYSNGEASVLESGRWTGNVNSETRGLLSQRKGSLRFSDGVYNYSIFRSGESYSEICRSFFSTSSDISPDFYYQMSGHIRTLPTPLLRTLADRGQFIRLERLVIDRLPHLKEIQPPGYPAGSTYSQAGGIYVSNEGAALVAESVLSRNGRLSSTGLGTETLRHELGHAMDYAFDRPSEHQTFRQIYESDVAKIPQAERANLDYFLQSGSRGPEEVFAESFNIATTPSRYRARNEELFKANFPRSLEFVRHFLEVNAAQPARQR
jgi:hypothetical protein